MWPTLPLYWLAWGAAGLLFALCGARAVGVRAHRAGTRTGALLYLTPLIAVVLALCGARVHALLAAPAALGRALLDGRALEVAAAGGQRIAGGLLLAALFLCYVAPRFARGALRGGEILDALVPFAGMAVAVGRLGCFAAGCCFGVPGEWPWCLHYPTGSPAYWNHVAQGLIPDAGGPSLAVHPVSAYLGVAALAAGLASRASARHLRRSGSATLLFIIVLSGFRLVIEPLRETRAIGGVPGQGTIDLLLVLGCLPWLVHRERNSRRFSPRGAMARCSAQDGPPKKRAIQPGLSSPGMPTRCSSRAVLPSS